MFNLHDIYFIKTIYEYIRQFLLQNQHNFLHVNKGMRKQDVITLDLDIFFAKFHREFNIYLYFNKRGKEGKILKRKAQ